MKKGVYINDSIHGLIPLSAYEKRIISSTEFNRLHDVYQNSTVYLTFPTNRTKRFEHSIGTMKLCSDIFFSSVSNSSVENIKKFYEIFSTEYNKMIKDVAKNNKLWEEKLGGHTPNKLPEIELDRFRHSLIPHNVPEQYQIIHLLLIQSIRVAALLHDIGHPPFSHIVENALKSSYESCVEIQDENERIKKFSETMSKCFGDKKENCMNRWGMRLATIF